MLYRYTLCKYFDNFRFLLGAFSHLSLLFPVLAEAYDIFLPFYTERLEPYVEEDLLDLKVNVLSLRYHVVILRGCRVNMLRRRVEAKRRKQKQIDHILYYDFPYDFYADII